MTSYEWQEGHCYGTHARPRYSAISYTWGRYMLNSPTEQPHVKSIEIKGLTWNIPRIDEAHFTVAQFETLIRQSVAERVNPKPNPSWASCIFEFVWLDIACINQTPGHPQMASEIGRQAKIFRMAKRVLVWLSRSSRALLERAIQKIIIAAETAEEDHTNTLPAQDRWTTSSGYRSKAILTGRERWLTSALTYLKLLIKDKWFSSLWTLQEAFLSQWAYVISAEVEPVRDDSPQLHGIFSACDTLNKICKRSVSHKITAGQTASSVETELVDILEKSGFAALAVENAIALYTMASNRIASRPVDYIYGIMQVFGFQLGISAPNADPRIHPDLPELELQLGKRLIEDYPMLSQLHVHSKPVEIGQGWRVSSSSIVPDVSKKVPFHVTSSFLGYHTPLCKLSYKDIAGVTWGSFSGKVCAFEHLERAWLSIDSRVEYANSIYGKSTQQIVLDSTNLVSKGEFSENPQNDIPRDTRQHKLATDMLRVFKQKKLSASVLLLGRFSDDDHGEDFWEMAGGHLSEFNGDRFNVGLILVKPQGEAEEFWRRLGICIWDLSHLTLRRDDTPGRSFHEALNLNGINAPEKTFLEGLTDDWKQVEGLFG